MPADPDFIEIRTDRLVIRRFRPEDIRAFAAYRSDPDVARYQSWDAYTGARAETFVAEMAALHPGMPGEWYQFAVADIVNDGLLGDTALCVDADDPSRAKLGFTFAPAYQRKGYATEAARGTIGYALERLDVDVVIGITDARNARSMALLERIGMSYVSSEHVKVKGEWCDEHTYELRRDNR
jgi:aminoglycoside 6'-N-acetyltransferase